MLFYLFTCHNIYLQIFFLLSVLTESCKVASETDCPEKDSSTTNLQVQEHDCEQITLLSRWNLPPLLPPPQILEPFLLWKLENAFF